jgi:hypothetical protein
VKSLAGRLVAAALGGFLASLPAAAADQEREHEIERGDQLEGEIQSELKRQKELLVRMRAEEGARKAPRRQETRAPASARALAERADPRIAPMAPEDRELPLEIFDKQEKTIPPGAWGNAREIDVIAYSLDADRDRRPEQIRYYDRETNVLLRVELDRDYNGRIDAWQEYEGGALVRRTLDQNGDGKPDVWEEYRDGRMTSRQVDRNHDGVRDAFYVYRAGSLVEERHDSNDDGKIDVIVKYENRVRVALEEDRDYDGRMDQWTHYELRGDREVPARIERDTNGDGRPDVFENYDTSSGQPVLTRREEDRNGDGKIDVTSIYENGKLVRREISDPALVPL